MEYITLVVLDITYIGQGFDFTAHIWEQVGIDDVLPAGKIDIATLKNDSVTIRVAATESLNLTRRAAWEIANSFNRDVLFYEGELS